MGTVRKTPWTPIPQDGLAFAVETKTWRYDERHLRRVREQAAWLGRRRRMRGALPVLCIIHAAELERWEGGVLVVSIDRLVAALWAVANETSSAAA